MELLFYATVVVFLLSCYLQNGYALKCYHCTTRGPSPDLKCNGTVVNCTGGTFCNTYSIKGSDNTYDFTRDCVSEDVCKPNYCENFMSFTGKTNCSVSCCTEDLCNGDVIKQVYSSSGQLLTFISRFSLMVVIVLACIS